MVRSQRQLFARSKLPKPGLKFILGVVWFNTYCVEIVLRSDLAIVILPQEVRSIQNVPRFSIIFDGLWMFDRLCRDIYSFMACLFLETLALSDRLDYPLLL